MSGSFRTGNSTSKERVEILKRFITCLGKAVISDFCGDKEFASIHLLKYLFSESIPFTLRIKSVLRDIKPGETRVMKQILFLKHKVDIVAFLDSCGELVITATNHNIDRLWLSTN